MNALEQLESIITNRSQADPNSSWTAKLLASGRTRCAQKFGEEAIETVLAGSSGSKSQLIHEASDVFYHLLVLLHANGVSMAEIMTELEHRQRQSGIAEKRSRPK